MQPGDLTSSDLLVTADGTVRPWTLTPDHMLAIVESVVAQREWGIAPGQLQVVGDRIAHVDRPAGDIVELDVGHGSSPVALLVEGTPRAQLERARQTPGDVRVVALDSPIQGWAIVDEVDTPSGRLFLQRRPLASHAATFGFAEALVIAHPGLDAFLDAYLEAHRDVRSLRVDVSGALAGCIDVHHAPGPLYAGQVRPVDIELHPLRVPRRGVGGTITAHDGSDPISEGLKVTLARSRAVGIVIVTDRDPYMSAARLTRTARLVRSGTVPPWIAALRIAGRVRRHQMRRQRQER